MIITDYLFMLLLYLPLFALTLLICYKSENFKLLVPYTFIQFSFYPEIAFRKRAFIKVIVMQLTLFRV